MVSIGLQPDSYRSKSHSYFDFFYQCRFKVSAGPEVKVVLGPLNIFTVLDGFETFEHFQSLKFFHPIPNRARSILMKIRSNSGMTSHSFSSGSVLKILPDRVSLVFFSRCVTVLSRESSTETRHSFEFRTYIFFWLKRCDFLA